MNRAQLRDRIERLGQKVDALKRQRGAQGRPSAVDSLVSVTEAKNHVAAFGKPHPRLSPEQRGLATADAAEYRRRYASEPPVEWLLNRRLLWDLQHELVRRGVHTGKIRAAVGFPDPDSSQLEDQEALVVADICALLICDGDAGDRRQDQEALLVANICAFVGGLMRKRAA